jgi:hypothetical protein
MKKYLTNKEVSFGKHIGHQVAKVSYQDDTLFTANENYVDPNNFDY